MLLYNLDASIHMRQKVVQCRVLSGEGGGAVRPGYQSGDDKGRILLGANYSTYPTEKVYDLLQKPNHLCIKELWRTFDISYQTGKVIY